MVDQIKSVQDAFMAFTLRAEKATDTELIESFVATGPMLNLLSNTNNSIVYGRRGTGKTHALKYVTQIAAQRQERATYIDLRMIGSNTSIYSDGTRSVVERASQLLNDVFRTIASDLYDLAVEGLNKAPHPQEITRRVDDLLHAVSQVKVIGSFEEVSGELGKTSTEGKTQIEASLKSLTASGGVSGSTHSEASHSVKRSGQQILHIDFGNVGAALEGLINVLPIKRLWLLIDEWSEIPIDLQPYLADLLRRTLLPINSCTVKIAAIEHRTNFSIRKDRGQYIGLEIGADISANINFDDFLVFESNEERSLEFFKQLLFKHYANSEHFDESVATPDALVQVAFTQHNAFAEFVRAVEGVPRDAMNLASIAALKAYGTKISMQEVRSSARDWYYRDKQRAVKQNENLEESLKIIVEEVIGQRNARAFMFPSNTKHRAIDELFDARLLHVLKRNISGKDVPGARYDAYKIDYGCYVDLRTTDKNPNNMFGDDEELKGVPSDDYRSIRRAILSPDMLPPGE